MKKGFTLIELIGSISIIAIVALIAFPVISGVLKKGSDDIDSYTQKIIISSANKYVNEHKDDFPKQSGLGKNVSVEDLYNNGYIEESFYDKHKKDVCDDEIIVKSNDEKYTFEYHSNKNSGCDK